jgi:Rrf2 family iron-sulfur cluster assembly transcriptional regulator
MLFYSGIRGNRYPRDAAYPIFAKTAADRGHATERIAPIFGCDGPVLWAAAAPSAFFDSETHQGTTTMRLSTKGRYAVTAMLDLALSSGKGPVTLADISVNQGISLSYLEQLFAALRGKQLVRGVRGPGGGYYLGKPSEEISIADIICAVDEWVEFTRCGGRENCHEGQRCLTHTLWDQLSDEIFSFLNDISLADLVRRGLGDGADVDVESLPVPDRKRAA